jgi:hypothetical protein
MNYAAMSISSIKTALFVGTLLGLLNRYEEIFSGQFSMAELFKR